MLNCSSSHDSNNCNSVILAHCLLRVQTVIFFCKGEVYPPVPHLTPSPPLCLPFLPLLHLPFLHPSFYPTLLSLQRSGPFKCSYVWGCCKLPHRDGGRIAPAGKSRGAENARQENDGQWIIGRGGVEMHIWKMQDWNMTEIKSAGVSVIRRQIIKFSLHEWRDDAETRNKHLQPGFRLAWAIKGDWFTVVAKLLGKPDDEVGRCEWERVGCVWRHRYPQQLASLLCAISKRFDMTQSDQCSYIVLL